MRRKVGYKKGGIVTVVTCDVSDSSARNIW